METMHDSDIGCDVPSGVSDASASLEAFEMLIETVNMSQKSMGDACLCALKCGRIGLENKVTELLIRKLENVPTLERKIVLLYVVNHILHASRFAAGWMRTYVLAFKEALPRIIGAGGPPGPDAEEYRKTCQRFLREWKIKQVLPSFFLRPFITEPNRYQFPPRSSVHRPYHSTRGNQLNAYERIELGKHDISAIDSKNPEPSSSTKHWLSSSTFVSGTDGMYPSPSAVKGPFPISSSSLQADVAPSPTLRRPSITGYSNKDMTAGFPTRRPHTDQRMYTFSSNGHAYIHKTCDEKLIYQAALEDLNQPNLEANLPDGLLSVSLLRHQKIALAWMLQKETCKSLPCLGGILADEQGLGKTISMIALKQMQRFLQSKSKPEYLDKDKVRKTTYEQRPTTDATLVVCPASVLRQWDRELDDKVADEAKLSVLVYHGGNRTKINPDELARYNVVLTTYAIVTNECLKGPRVGKCVFDFSINNKKRKMASSSSSSSHRGSGPLARVDWYRVILDEAQMIKNHTTQVAKACCSLEAKTRWCLSGTPIQNRIDDLYSYFRFLKYDPYDAYGSFQHMIKGSISRDSQQGYKKVQAILRAIMLRRRKETIIDGQPILNLPPKTINLRQVRFSSKERAFYNQVESGSRAQFKAYADAGTINQNYAHILVMLLRLRQACDHPLLVSDEKDSVDMASDKLSRDMLMHLLNVLEDSEAICCVCNDVPENPVVTMCGHVLCFQCVSEHMTGDDSMCATTDECMELPIFSKSTLRSRLSFRDNLDGGQMSTENSKSPSVEYYMSSKVRTTIELLQSSSHDDDDSSYPNIKTIIFSQWTKMLDLVENAIKDYCRSIQYRRLDGTMTLASRDMAVKEFNTDPEVTVMLMSLKAGNLGLNMVSACHVFLLDPWWNPTTEDQAVDRAHRIGQTRPVTVTRLTIKDTVEDRILALQDKKKKMVASAFGEDNAGGCATRLTVEDLKYLFMV